MAVYDTETKKDDDTDRLQPVREAEQNPDAPSSEQDPYDREFAALTDPEHMAKDGEEPDTVGKGYTGGGKGKGLQKITSKGALSDEKRKRLNKKRAAIAGGVAGVLVGGGLVGITSLAQVGQLVQLRGILGNTMLKSDGDSANRLSRQLRYAKTGDIGETRIGLVGSAIYGKTIGQLRDIGITFERSASGYPTRTNFDAEKLKTAFPDTANMNDEEFKTFLSQQLSDDTGRITPDMIQGEKGLYFIDQSNFRSSDTRLLAKSTIKFLGNGKVVSAIKFRPVVAAWNAFGVLHPFQKAVADAENKAAAQIADAKKKGTQTDTQSAQEQVQAAGEQAIEQQFDHVTAATEARAAPAVDDIEAKKSLIDNPASKALLLTGLACLVYDTADSIVTINHDRVVTTSSIEATRRIAQGDQLKAGGPDITHEQLSLENASLTGSDGATVWQSQPIEALGYGTYNTSSTDIPPIYKQAFSSDTTAANIRAGIQTTLPGFDLKKICSGPGLIVQAAAGLTLSIASLIGDASTGGVLTPGMVALWAAKEGVQFGVSSVAMHYIEKFVLDKTTSAVLKSAAFRGAVGGALMGYGARAMANANAVSSGGVDLGNRNSTIGLAQANQTSMANFRSESLFARMFDANDGHSLAGHFVTTVSPSFSQNLMHLADTITNMPRLLGSVFGSLLPRAGAAQTPPTYDWGFGQAGIPDSLLNDGNLQNPYDNGKKVAQLLDSSGCRNGDTVNTDCTLYKRINSCFGNQLTFQDGVWDVATTSDVNMTSQDYLDAHCNDVGGVSDTRAGDSTGDWRRVVMFVNDSHDVCAAASFLDYKGNCGSTPAAPVATAVPAGDQKSLAQQVLNNKNIIFEQPSDKQDIEETVAGQPMTCTDDYGSYVLSTGISADLLTFMLQLAAKYQYHVTAMFSGHGGHNTGGDPNNGCHDGGRHPMGRAIDVGTINSTLITGSGGVDTGSYSGNVQGIAHEFANYAMTILPKGSFVNGQPVKMGGVGQKQCFSPALSPPPGINHWDDLCNHMHLDVGVAQAAATQ